MKVLIAGASPDAINNNAVLRGYVANGFRGLDKVADVTVCSLESATMIAKAAVPDLILVFGSCMPLEAHYLPLKQVAMDLGATMAFWLHDDPYEFDHAAKIVPLADIIFSNDKWTSTHYPHPHVVHLPLAADPNAHFRNFKTEKARDLFFCGVGFNNRVQLLRDCAAHLRDINVEVLGDGWPEDLGFAANRRIRNDVLPDMYASSLITLNVGRRHNLANERFNLDASTPGPRTFEAAAAGTVQCMFVEGLEISDYYDESSGEILLFDSPAELRQHCEMLKDDPAMAKRISLAAQARTLRDHTYQNRAEKILHSVQRLRSI
ncbi:CgeB family protein [Burkholderia vietnamiensis]|uniref:CgeB family protein n=1 Tax=Burkholderia vietnamiensis TaxID=60552 RepID=UPI002DD43A82|nr:glycosyltransferase [Burkholderia vietnamiensis]MEC4596532.1 glycosyltransferase [Burkholderia vietnamiensis]